MQLYDRGLRRSRAFFNRPQRDGGSTMPFPTALRGVLLTTPWLLHLLLADLLLSALLPISTILPTFTYSACSYIAYTVWFVIQHIFTSVNGAHIIVSGDLLPPGESAIVIANHVSWTDFYMIQALAMRSGMLGRCRWFAKQQLKWVPFLGWGLYAMGMPLVSRNWVKDRKELDSIFGKIRTNQWPICKSTCYDHVCSTAGAMWLMSRMQGSFHTARLQGTLKRSMHKLSSGAKPVASQPLNTSCTLGPGVLLRRCRS